MDRFNLGTKWRVLADDFKRLLIWYGFKEDQYYKKYGIGYKNVWHKLWERADSKEI